MLFFIAPRKCKQIKKALLSQLKKNYRVSPKARQHGPGVYRFDVVLLNLCWRVEFGGTEISWRTHLACSYIVWRVKTAIHSKNIKWVEEFFFKLCYINFEFFFLVCNNMGCNM